MEHLEHLAAARAAPGRRPLAEPAAISKADLLDASRPEAQRVSLDRRPFDVDSEVRSLLLRLRPTLGGRQVLVQTRDAPVQASASCFSPYFKAALLGPAPARR